MALQTANRAYVTRIQPDNLAEAQRRIAQQIAGGRLTVWNPPPGGSAIPNFQCLLSGQVYGLAERLPGLDTLREILGDDDGDESDDNRSSNNERSDEDSDESS